MSSSMTATREVTDSAAAVDKPTAMLGKNAAIRQIMKEREKKMMLRKRQKENTINTDDEDDSSVGEPQSKLIDDDNKLSTTENEERIPDKSMTKEDATTKRASSPFFRGMIPHAVTFEDEVCLAEKRQQYLMIDDDQSLSSSYWAMMEDFYGSNDPENEDITECNAIAQEKMIAISDEAAELLGTSLISINSDNKSSSINPASPSSDDSKNKSKESKESSLSLSSTAKNNDDGCAGELFPDCDANSTTISEKPVDVSKLSINSFPPSELTATPPRGLIKPLAAVPTSSPFSTFRQNSTNIALHETQFYYRKIEALEKKLAHAEDKAAKEEARRIESERRSKHLFLQEDQARMAGAKTPGAMKTPAPPGSALTVSGKSYRSYPATPGGSVVLPESLWERNKTLVKEVCFAGQTCVELSGQKMALEKHLDLLEKQYEKSIAKNESLTQEIHEANLKSARAEAEVESLRERLSEKERKTDLITPRHEGPHTEAEQNKLEDESVISGEAMKAQIEHLESQLDNARKACRAGELREHAFQKSIKSLTAKLESSRSDNEALKSQMKQERIQLAAKLKSASVFMDQKSAQLSERMLSKVSELDARLREISSAVEFMSEEMSFDAVSEQSSTPSYDGNQGNSVESEGTVFNATFSDNQNRSADLQLMEEARTNANILNHRHLEVSCSSSCMNEPSVSTRSEGTTLSSINGLSQVISGMSSLSHDNSKSSVTGDGDAKFFQHLKWMTSPDSVRENSDTPVVANRESDAHEFQNLNNEDEYDEEKLQSQNDVDHDVPSTSQNNGLGRQIQSPVAALHGSLGKQFGDSIPALSERNPALDKATLRIKELEAAAAQSEELECKLQTAQREKDSQQNELSAKSQALEEAQLSLVNSKGERDLLNDRLTVLTGEKEQLAKSIETLTEQKRELEHAASSYAKATKELKSLRDRFDCLHEEKEEARAKFETTLSSLTQARNEIRELQASVAKLSSAANESESLRGNLESLQVERDELLAKLNSKTCAIQNEVTAPAQGFGSAQIRFDTLQREEKELELQLRKKAIFPKRPASTNYRDNEAIKSLEEANVKLGLEVKTLTSSLKEAVQKNVKLSATEAALEQITNAFDSLKGEAATLLADKEKLEQTLLDTKDLDCLRLRTDLDDLQAAYDNCNDALQSLLQKNADLESEIETIQVMHQGAEDRAFESESRLLQMRNDFEQISVDRDALFTKLEALSASLETLNKERTALKTQLESKSAAFRMIEVARDAAIEEAQKNHKQAENYAAERAVLELLLTKKEAEAQTQAVRLADLVERNTSVELELSETKEILRQNECKASELHERNESLVTKCDRLRDYIRKLTRKCDEWEMFHLRESQVLEQLKIAHDRTRQKASDLAARVHQRDQLHSAQKAAWDAEHSCLKQVKGQLELELDVIAEELSSIRPAKY